MECLFRYCRGIEPHLALREESRVVSRVAAGSFGFLSSFQGYLKEPFVFPQGSQAYYQIVRGTSGFLSSRFRGI